MKDSVTKEGTNTQCENCGGIFYTKGDFTTRCDNCGASIANTETGQVYRSGNITVFTTPGGTPYSKPAMECSIADCDNPGCAHYGEHKENPHCGGNGCPRHKEAVCTEVKK